MEVMPEAVLLEEVTLAADPEKWAVASVDLKMAAE